MSAAASKAADATDDDAEVDDVEDEGGEVDDDNDEDDEAEPHRLVRDIRAQDATRAGRK